MTETTIARPWLDTDLSVDERVQLLLERSGSLSWERAFLAVYLDQFADVHPERGHLRQRASELKVYPLRRKAAAPRRQAKRAVAY